MRKSRDATTKYVQRENSLKSHRKTGGPPKWRTIHTTTVHWCIHQLNTPWRVAPCNSNGSARPLCMTKYGVAPIASGCQFTPQYVTSFPLHNDLMCSGNDLAYPASCCIKCHPRTCKAATEQGMWDSLPGSSKIYLRCYPPSRSTQTSWVLRAAGQWSTGGTRGSYRSSRELCEYSLAGCWVCVWSWKVRWRDQDGGSKGY
jgi:hypothetical protein